MVYCVLVLAAAAAAAAECNTLCILYKTVVAHRHVVIVSVGGDAVTVVYW